MHWYRAIDAASLWLGHALRWFILAATVISAVNAVLRKLFDIGSNAFLELQWYLFAAVFLLGMGYAFLVNAHVRIDIFAKGFSARTRAIIDIVGIIAFVLPLSYFMISFAWPIVERAYVTGEVSSNAGGLIRWPLYALVPLGYGLLALQAVSELAKRLLFLLGRAPDPLAVAGEH